jgi:LAO/AO transport system kinase
MEMVDLIFINKVDENNLQKAKLTKVELKRALHFLPEKEKNWKVPVLLGSALENTGLDEVFEEISNYINQTKSSGSFHLKRKNQAEKRFDYWVQEYILQKTKTDSKMQDLYDLNKKNASELKANPSSEAKNFVEELMKNSNS